ncbi:FMN-dependent NADH-azoreductase [Allosphingosinicella vermicomposti]|uniref:FMN-dependent NADH-azoreductase n=1 Tax=Allosphingosinicella vermicomposti TaxID=614671 RepID=UPI000D10ED45|nr:FMN-dependent NADH-azoreductase [Allosphingosinicella vermicomposti]
MSNILIINSSAHGSESVSSRLTGEFAARVQAANPGTTITIRDVGRDPLPHLVAETVAGIRNEVAETEAERQTRAISDALIEEMRTADLIVIGAPMYNFGISSTLKAWFDYVVRARVTFRYTENGPEGLMTGKRVIVIESRAGVYSDEASSAMDFQEPHLKGMLGFMGMTDVDFVRAEGLAFGEDVAEAAIRSANETLARLAARELALAA